MSCPTLACHLGQWPMMVSKLKKLSERCHRVCDGSANSLLNQLTADATGLEVVAGPVEATVMGNLVMQALLDGSIASLDDVRDMIALSFQTKRYTPTRGTDWDALQCRIAHWSRLIPST